MIHSGIYYKSGSFKARLYVEGTDALLRFCQEHSVPFDICGKVIVATSESELPRLEELYRRGNANKLKGLQMLMTEEIRETLSRMLPVSVAFTCRAQASWTTGGSQKS